MRHAIDALPVKKDTVKTVGDRGKGRKDYAKVGLRWQKEMCRFRLECRVLEVYEAMISIWYDEELRKGKIMVNTRWCGVLCLWACVCLAGCGEDSETAQPSGGGDTPERTEVEEGGACVATEECAGTLVCRDGVCAAPSETPDKPGDSDKEVECDFTKKCALDKVCVEGKCLVRASLSEACGEGMHCVLGECIEGFCKERVALGEYCEAATAVCDDGAVCSEQSRHCVFMSAFGESCDDTHECELGLVCMGDETCVRSVKVGEACDETENICFGNVCDDGICKAYATDKTCDATTYCGEEKICFGGLCMNEVACESDSDCEADSYCCTEEGCETKNVCAPYGMGPRGETNTACVYQTEPGLFEADLQCEWTGPAADDPYSKSKSVVTPVFVAKTPHEAAGTSNTLIYTTFVSGDWNQVDEAYKYGVIRLLNPETCQLLENVYDPNHYVTAGVALAVGDVDKTGHVAIFAARSTYQPKNVETNTGDPGGIVKFKWSEEEKKYVVDWYVTNKHGIDGTKLTTVSYAWGGLALHDVNNDGVAELLTPSGEVLNAQTGVKLNGSQVLPLESRSKFPTVGDLDKDGQIEWIAEGGNTNYYLDVSGQKVTVGYGPNVYEWTVEKDESGAVVKQYWAPEYTQPGKAGDHLVLHAFADFGTPGATAEDFDWNTPDGMAEFVSTSGIEAGKGSGQFAIHALTQTTNADGSVEKSIQRVMEVTALYGGGAPTIGDFDGDTLPEVGVAFGDYYRVIDPRCKANAEGQLPEGCAKANYLWEMKNQDDSSYTTGSAVFDFDGDGQIEVVYSDECFTRIYDGKTGVVLFSAKQSSRTAYEMPTIADVDNDGSAEILVGANAMDRTCSAYDKTHLGIRCKDNNDCTSKRCVDNFCACETDAECNWRKNADGSIKSEYTCMLQNTEDAASPKVCRAKRATGQVITGVRVMRDRYDRWVAARNLWNQFPYSITNISDDFTIPSVSSWIQNFVTAGLNNYRANAQGALGANVAPDITGKLEKDDVCMQNGEEVTLHGVVCNRGTKTVAAKMPASFYKINDDGTLGTKYCTAYTSANVPTGGCLDVSCSLPASDVVFGLRIRMKSNDDGEGGRTTVECNPDNNDDEIILTECRVN